MTGMTTLVGLRSGAGIRGAGPAVAAGLSLATLFGGIAAAQTAEGRGAPKARPQAAQPLAVPDAALETPEGTLGYALGIRIGTRIAADFRAQKAPFDFAALAQGLSDAVNGVPPRLPEGQMVSALQAFEERMQKEGEAFRQQMVEKGRANKAKGINARHMVPPANLSGAPVVPPTPKHHPESVACP